MTQPVVSEYNLIKHPLTYLRAQRGWSQQDLVDAIATSARKLGVPLADGYRKKAWRWENRGVTPEAEAQRALAYVLDIPYEQVQMLPWPRWLPVGEAVPSDYPWTIEGCLQALYAVEDALLDRRGFLTVGGTALTAAAAGWADHEPERVVGALKGGRLDEETVTWAEERIPGLRRMDDRLSGRNLLRLVSADLTMVTELIDCSTYSESLERRLYRVAAELGQLAGWVAFDIGHHSAAQRYYLGALHAAHQANDRAQGANVLAGLSFQQALNGEPRDGVALADTAQEHARTAPPRVRALIASRQARAHARDNNAGACNRALLQAEQMLQLAETSSGDDPAWVYYFDRAELEAQAGACFVDLRQPRTAEELLSTALADQDPSYVRDRTIYLVRSAAAQLQFGQLDHACALAGQAAQLAQKSYSGRSIASVKAFRASLKPYSSSPHVAALDNKLGGLGA